MDTSKMTTEELRAYWEAEVVRLYNAAGQAEEEGDDEAFDAAKQTQANAIFETHRVFMLESLVARMAALGYGDCPDGRVWFLMDDDETDDKAGNVWLVVDDTIVKYDELDGEEGEANVYDGLVSLSYHTDDAGWIDILDAPSNVLAALGLAKATTQRPAP